MQDKRNKRIGVFDSGIGGLTVVRELIRRLPDEGIVYFGDSARVPYGTKSPETVLGFARENLKFLKSRNIKLIVVACNTVSAVALPILKSEEEIPVTGVLLPGALGASRATESSKVAVIGTTATIRSGAYRKALHAINPDLEIFSKACPLFVSLAEEGWLDNDVTRLVAEKYLEDVIEFGPDTVVLGCTHYPLLKGVISKVMGPGVRLVDSANECAVEVEKILAGNDLKKRAGSGGGIKVFMSDVPYKFREIGERFLGRSLGEVTKIQV
ncbi:MAG TPA: glutamate racemase [Candidatus Krumholzibacteriaceae bacterium]|nr:glutamate racemase [Candidatus Krumholzibacteriaceae bacterium]